MNAAAADPGKQATPAVRPQAACPDSKPAAAASKLPVDALRKKWRPVDVPLCGRGQAPAAATAAAAGASAAVSAGKKDASSAAQKQKKALAGDSGACAQAVKVPAMQHRKYSNIECVFFSPIIAQHIFFLGRAAFARILKSYLF